MACAILHNYENGGEPCESDSRTGARYHSTLVGSVGPRDLVFGTFYFDIFHSSLPA